MSAPTLIIGLGGTGSKVVLKVANMITDEQREKIGFAVFDTDVNELREIGTKNPFIHTIQTSTKLSVGEYLDIDTHSRDTWFPVNAILNSKTLTEGAGQVRAISRLAFETAVRAGKMEELHKAIEDLYRLEGDSYEQALRIIIVSSLAGGTGSGLLLPVALYIKNYLATRFRQSSNITRGFFLLPEVFYEVIKGQAERNNLKSNAYATLRELDAFLMKGDATLSERYKDSVKMEFPCAGTNEFEEYDIRPYDFCFLFDAQNADGKKLNSFTQYLDHAANCIYAQSIGPMNKRSNSSEDNTIRKLAQESGRNRYAGAGTSMLIYPKKDVQKYLALTWAKESVSDQWLVYDNQFKAQKEEIARARRNGIKIPDISPAKHYVDSVEQNAKNKDAFSNAIVNACTRYDETGVVKISDKWDDYLEALQKKIFVENSSGQEELDVARKQASDGINEITGENNSGIIRTNDETWDVYVSAYESLRKYNAMVQKYSENTARTIAFTIFKAANENIVNDRLDYQVETYLRDVDGNFIHPCAVRYFLYKVLEGMKKRKLVIEEDCRKEMSFFDGFEKNNFDDQNTEDVEETVYDLNKTKKVGIADRIRKRLSGDQEALKAAYQEFLKKSDDYRVNSVLVAIYEEGIEYISGIADAFQKFFLSFDEKIASIIKERDILERKYNAPKGSAARYVCASANCLKAMADDSPYTGDFYNIPNELAEKIYTRVRSYAMRPKKLTQEKTRNSSPKRKEQDQEYINYFGKLFSEGIIGHFEDSVLETYQDKIDMDIIDAIEKEAQYEAGILDPEKARQYIMQVFDESKVLASPFIEKPLGEEKDPINACAYNDKLNPHDDSPKSHLVDAELANFGGTEDSEIPKNMILFYKSFYGLRANDLSKFAPPSKGETYGRSAGEYYKAYFELIEDVHPEPHRSKVITPHIDRWWHIVNKMPDLDEGNQEKQQSKIYAAFFWGICGGYVDMFETGYEERCYRLLGERLGMEDADSTLVVSNGTPCDQLYEVVDALSIYPRLVSNILDDVEQKTLEEVNENVSVENGSLVRYLKRFRVKEYPLTDSEGKAIPRSIFDLPLLIKKSLTRELYFEDNVIKILNVELAEIKKYVTRFCSDKEIPLVMKEIIMNQFELFLRDLEIEKASWRDIYHDYLFTRTCGVIAKMLTELHLKDEAAYVLTKQSELSQ